MQQGGPALALHVFGGMLGNGKRASERAAEQASGEAFAAIFGGPAAGCAACPQPLADELWMSTWGVVSRADPRLLL